MPKNGRKKNMRWVRLLETLHEHGCVPVDEFGWKCDTDLADVLEELMRTSLTLTQLDLIERLVLTCKHKEPMPCYMMENLGSPSRR